MVQLLLLLLTLRVLHTNYHRCCSISLYSGTFVYMYEQRRTIDFALFEVLLFDFWHRVPDIQIRMVRLFQAWARPKCRIFICTCTMIHKQQMWFGKLQCKGTNGLLLKVFGFNGQSARSNVTASDLNTAREK